MTKVTNLATEEETIYDLPPFEAVVAAYQQFERKDFNTWDYPKPEEHAMLRIGKLTVGCGDWVALKG